MGPAAAQPLSLHGKQQKNGHMMPCLLLLLQVRGVILDPSCSGSGTVVSRMDHLLPAGAAQQAADPAQHDLEARGSSAAGDGSAAAAERRVEQLAKFQASAATAMPTFLHSELQHWHVCEGLCNSAS